MLRSRVRLEARPRQGRYRSVPAASALCVLALAAALAQTGPGLVVRGIRYPNYDARGNLRSVLEGKSAVVRTNEEVAVSGLTMEILGASGGVTRVFAEDCLYRPSVGKAGSDSAVRMEHAGAVVSGTGFSWRKDDDRVEIMRAVSVSVSNAAEWTGGTGSGLSDAGTGSVAIVSDRMLFRPEVERGVFTGNVRVDRAGMTLTADRLAVSMEEGRVLSAATATGNVTIVRPDSTGQCANVSIDADSGTIILSGKARVYRAGEELGGEKIAILEKRDRIVAESGYLRFKGIRRIETERDR